MNEIYDSGLRVWFDRFDIGGDGALTVGYRGGPTVTAFVAHLCPASVLVSQATT